LKRQARRSDGKMSHQPVGVKLIGARIKSYQY
jgi:hypothetical protein